VNAFAPTCVVLSHVKNWVDPVVLAMYITEVSSAAPQSSVVAPRKSTTSSCVKFLLPSGLM